MRQMQPHIIGLHNQGDRPIDQSGDANRHKGKRETRINQAWRLKRRKRDGHDFSGKDEICFDRTFDTRLF